MDINKKVRVISTNWVNILIVFFSVCFYAFF